MGISALLAPFLTTNYLDAIMKTETEESAEKVTCYNGKIVKLVGKEVARGQWPEDGAGGYRIGT